MVARTDGAALLRVMTSASARLEREVAEVNALNVYPLPDGDTGKNMLETMQAALRRAGDAGPSVGEVAAAIAQGALMGARGNSGVILSQILAGIRDGLAGKDELGAEDVRRAFALGRAKAYAAVVTPAEGTMLSVCRELDERFPETRDLTELLRAAVERGAAALERTMADNPMNRAAGVVDAGAYGLWLLLVGAMEETDPAARVPEVALRRPGAEGPVMAAAPDEVASWTGGHCVQYLVRSPRRPPEELRKEMVELGADSVLVVGDGTMLKVHVHAARPEAVMAVGESAGELEDVLVEDFDQQVAEHERSTGIVLKSPPRAIAAIAVVPGDGFERIVRSAYATPVAGGATMNPSVQEIFEAITAANARTVIVLPNDRNVILAAREAARLAQDIDVEVIPTSSVAQGMAALARFDPMSPAAEIGALKEAMRASVAEAHGVEVTRATRDSEVDGVAVRRGDAIAMVDGKLGARGSDPIEVLVEAVRGLEGIGIVTLYAGHDVTDGDGERAAEALRAALGDRVEKVELLHGGQPHYPFIAQAE